jgi:tripartite-type tricarboxylate transporter receptor subunit TctC
MKRHILAAAAALCWAIVPVVHAQSNNAPLRLVVPFPPGDALDSTARALAEFTATELQRTIVVENKPGASGFIAADSVAQSHDTGTFLLGTTAMMSITPFLKKAPYSPSDFTPVARFATITTIVAVPSGFPAKTWPEFVALAKKNPGKYTYASPGEGTIIHMGMESLQRSAGIQLLHVPYKGMGPALQDFLGGRVDIYSEPAVINHIKAGTARGLAVMSNNRLNELPDVPSLKEVGVTYENEAWLGVFAPKNTPAGLVTQMGAALAKAAARPEIQGKLPPGVQIGYLGKEPFAQKIRSEQTSNKKLISDLNIKLD